LFETKRDVRYFLAGLARLVRSGDLEVHAYSVLTTHFHLLVRSPRGRLSAAMQRWLDSYARWFNRGRKRDGPLFRGRFVNRLVESDTYWVAVLQYIDNNPVTARLAARPVDYTHGSAWHYARLAGPAWLSRRMVEAVVRGREDGSYDPRDYVAFSEKAMAPGMRWIVERRLGDAAARGRDPLDDFVSAAPGRVRAWMERKARLADGTAPGMAIASPTAVHACVARRRLRDPQRRLGEEFGSAPWWEVQEAGLLRACAGLRQEDIAGRMRLVLSTLQRRLRTFSQATSGAGPFLDEAAELTAEALRRDCGAGLEPRARPLRIPRIVPGATVAPVRAS
jgi:REP element-mobilizing transposase RayT